MVPSGIPFSNNVFVMNHFATMSHHALVGWLLDTATKQEQHPLFNPEIVPKWVAGPVRFRQHAAALSLKEEAAKYKDTQALKERDLERAATMESIHNNACYIIMNARYQNDDTLYANTGHEVKEQIKRAHAPVTISTEPLTISVKRGDQPGSVVLTIERDPGAGIYQVQFCKGVPSGEESWLDYGNFKKVKISIPNLERAGWYYFRVRSHGDNETSPWSMPVDIIVG